MTSADAARRVPWLRFALLGVVVAGIWLVISLFSSSVGAAAEEGEPPGVEAVPADPGTAPEATDAATGTSGEAADAVAEPVAEPSVEPGAEPAAEPVAEAAAPVDEATRSAHETAVHEVPVAEPSPRSGSAMDPGADSPPPGVDVANAATEGEPTDATPVGPGVADDANGDAAKPASPAPADRADQPGAVPVQVPRNETPPGLADKAEPPAQTPAQLPEQAPDQLPAPRNDAPPGLADKAEPPAQTPAQLPEQAPAQLPEQAPHQLPAPQNDTPPGLAEKDVEAPTVEAAQAEHSSEVSDGLGKLSTTAPASAVDDAAEPPSTPTLFAAALAPGSKLSGPPSGLLIFHDDVSTPGSYRTDGAGAPAEAMGAITPADGMPAGGTAPGAPGAPASGGAAAGGAGGAAGGSGAGSGAAGASGTSDATFAAVGLGALASLVLHSVDDELPSSPVYDTDTTPD